MNSMGEENRSYYAIIPANVRYNEKLNANAKLLYGEITALCNQEGYCWATNDYFSKLYNVSKTTISRWIKDLKDNGYISVEMVYKNGTKEIECRYIRICGEGINKNDNTPINKNVKDNNTCFNNTNNNKRKKETTYDEIINSKIDNEEIKELLYEFIKMRKMKKKPLTDRALTMQINKLQKLSSDIEIQKKIIEKSIVKCWDEFYEYKEDINSKTKECIKDVDLSGF